MADKIELPDAFNRYKRTALLFSAVVIVASWPGVEFGGTTTALGVSFKNVNPNHAIVALWSCALFYFLGAGLVVYTFFDEHRDLFFVKQAVTFSELLTTLYNRFSDAVEQCERSVEKLRNYDVQIPENPGGRDFDGAWLSRRTPGRRLTEEDASDLRRELAAENAAASQRILAERDSEMRRVVEQAKVSIQGLASLSEQVSGKRRKTIWSRGALYVGFECLLPIVLFIASTILCFGKLMI